MTRGQERVAAVLLLLWCGFWGVSFLQAREAKAQVIEMDRVEAEFYGVTVKVDALHANARATAENVFSFTVKK